jgi:L-fuconolactonase
MRLDSHQHFWDYSRNSSDYVWMGTNDGVLKHNFLPGDLEPLMTRAGYNGTIAVQAREKREETDFLLDLAASNPFIKGVVGWLDLCDPNIADQIAHYAHNKTLKGLRMLIHDQSDLDFAHSKPHARGVAILRDYGLTYDLLLRPQHIASALRLVESLQDQSFVVDHMAKPIISDKPDPQWTDGIKRLARHANVYCKLSGVATLLPADKLSADRFKPYIDLVLEAFSPARCMIGSDWPVANLGADYHTAMGLIETCLSELNSTEQADILGLTCARFYRV